MLNALLNVSASLTGGSRHSWDAGRRVASVSDEPSNAASEFLRNAFAFFTEAGSPSEEVVRAGLTDDFAYEDRRSGPSFPDADAESFPKFVVSHLANRCCGQPRCEHETLAVRGERFAAVAVQPDYGNGMLGALTAEMQHPKSKDVTLAAGASTVNVLVPSQAS